MFYRELHTKNSEIKLVCPNIERDAPLSVEWLNGKSGHETQKSMGISEKDNKPTTLEQEKQRIADSIHQTNQHNWMIMVGGVVIGSVWVELNESDQIGSPSLSIMIGDPQFRHKGIAEPVVRAVLDFLKARGFWKVYARHIPENKSSQALLEKLGFTKDGSGYTDKDGVTWQNYVVANHPKFTNSEGQISYWPSKNYQRDLVIG